MHSADRRWYDFILHESAIIFGAYRPQHVGSVILLYDLLRTGPRHPRNEYLDGEYSIFRNRQLFVQKHVFCV